MYLVVLPEQMINLLSAVFAHTVNAQAPSSSMGGSLIYSPRYCMWDYIEHSLACHRGARERTCVCE
jgi:hypothetical protein